MIKTADYPIYSRPQEGVVYLPGRNFHRDVENRSVKAQPVLDYHPLGNVWVGIEWISAKLGILTLTALKRQVLGGTSFKPASITNQMKELGVKVSPPGMCFPFKATVGYLLEMQRLFEELKTKIDFEVYLFVLSHISRGPCRERIYSRLQETRLGDRSLDFAFYAVDESIEGLLKFLWFLAGLLAKSRFPALKFVKKIMVIPRIIGVFNEGIERLVLVEKFERETRFIQSLIGDSNFDWAEDILVEAREKAADANVSFAQLTRILKKSREELEKIPKVRTEPIGVTVITGEIFHCAEIEDCSGNIEQESAKRGFRSIRDVGLSHYLPRYKITLWRFLKFLWSQLNPFSRNKNRELAKRGGLKRDAGGHSVDTVALWQEIREAIEKGESICDGAFVVQPFGCMPEITARHVGIRLLREGKIHSLDCILDEQTSPIGLLTRVEAFLDMLEREKMSIK